MSFLDSAISIGFVRIEVKISNEHPQLQRKGIHILLTGYSFLRQLRNLLE